MSAPRASRPGIRAALAPVASAAVVLLVFVAGIAGVAAAGPPFPERQPDRVLLDDADAFTREQRRATTDSLRALRRRTGVEVVVYTQVKRASETPAQVRADALALLEAWQVGGPDGDGIVLFWDFERGRRDAILQIVAGEAYRQRHLDEAALDDIAATQVRDDLAAGRWSAALTRAVVAISIGTASLPVPGASPTPAPGTPGPSPGTTPSPSPGGPTRPGDGPPPGPPYPAPVEGQVVYDFADILSARTEASAAATIAAIETRTAAELVVYTQVKPESDTVEEAERDAIALMDQWGVGRRGFDDGLAVLFDMDESLCHGQVQLYAGPGYRAAFLSNEERQRIFEDDMLPLLRGCDIDGALLAALARIDANATPEHAATLQRARQIDALLGLVGAPLAFLLLVGWAASTWLRLGKDPVYLDSPSILMPAPPPDLTAATGALVYDGRMSRRALTTAMLDLASRGELAFREDKGLLDLRPKLGVQMLEPALADPQTVRNRRKPLGRAEVYVLERLRSIGHDEAGYIDPKELLTFGTSVDTFEDRLEKEAVSKGWFREAPSKSSERWTFRGGAELVVGFIGALFALDLPSQGLLLVSLAVLAAGVVTLAIARLMPARTMAGAMIQAMLAAYRRTLQRTMEQARSMKQVVESAQLPWLETPDQALVWGVALGLQDDVERVLERSADDARAGVASSGQGWLPSWYHSRGGVTTSSASATAGLFSSSAVPDFGGMMGALSTIGNAPSSSGGSGGFSGGGSGGGGGGSGGGF